MEKRALLLGNARKTGAPGSINFPNLVLWKDISNYVFWKYISNNLPLHWPSTSLFLYAAPHEGRVVAFRAGDAAHVGPEIDACAGELGRESRQSCGR